LATDLHPSTIGGDQVRIVTATVTALPSDPDGLSQVWSDMPLDPAHTLAGAPDSLFDRFSEHPENLSLARTIPITITAGEHITDGVGVLQALFAGGQNLRGRPGHLLNLRGQLIQLSDPKEPSTDLERSVDVLLTGGNDGRRPLATEYEGTAS